MDRCWLLDETDDGERNEHDISITRLLAHEYMHKVFHCQQFANPATENDCNIKLNHPLQIIISYLLLSQIKMFSIPLIDRQPQKRHIKQLGHVHISHDQIQMFHPDNSQI